MNPRITIETSTSHKLGDFRELSLHKTLWNQSGFCYQYEETIRTQGTTIIGYADFKKLTHAQKCLIASHKRLLIRLGDMFRTAEYGKPDEHGTITHMAEGMDTFYSCSKCGNESMNKPYIDKCCKGEINTK